MISNSNSNFKFQTPLNLPLVSIPSVFFCFPRRLSKRIIGTLTLQISFAVAVAILKGPGPQVIYERVFSPIDVPAVLLALPASAALCATVGTPIFPALLAASAAAAATAAASVLVLGGGCIGHGGPDARRQEGQEQQQQPRCSPHQGGHVGDYCLAGSQSLLARDNVKERPSLDLVPLTFNLDRCSRFSFL